MQRTGEGAAARTDEVPARIIADLGPHQRRAQSWFDQSLKTIFDDLSDGVLVVNAAGHRVYSNPALDDLVGTDACQPFDTSDPPPYVPRDQRQKYLRMLEAMASLLSVEGSGAASTRFELITRDRGRVRARMTIQRVPKWGPRALRSLSVDTGIGPCRRRELCCQPRQHEKRHGRRPGAKHRLIDESRAAPVAGFAHPP